jgi:hypothetical protein
MRSLDYCQYQAENYERRAAEADDDDVRAFLLLVRDSWLRAANRAQMRGALDRASDKLPDVLHRLDVKRR